MKRFFCLIQSLLGFLLSIYLVSVLLWFPSYQDWLSDPVKLNSLWVMIIIYITVFCSIQHFSIHLNRLNVRYILPAFTFWKIVTLSFLFIFQVDYSISYVSLSSFVMLVLFLLFDWINTINRQKTIAYVPLGKVNNLPNIPRITWKELKNGEEVDKKQLDVVMADLHTDLSDKWEHFLAECTLQHIPVYHSSRLLEMVTGRVKIDHMYENELGSLLPSKSYQVVKRLLDTGLIILSLPLVLPVAIITGILVITESRGGMFFLQERIGQGGVPFTVYKFRSMCKDSEKHGSQFAQANDMRVTRVGKFIRKTRIDELPQFYNVLKGEMSLIGPRPEQKKFVDEFNEQIPFYNYRHIVKPGISGWAQVTHGYAADAEDTKIKLEHDFYYIKNFSFSMDLLIFFKTIKTMLTGFGAR